LDFTQILSIGKYIFMAFELSGFEAVPEEQEVIDLLVADRENGVINPQTGETAIGEKTREKLVGLVAARENEIGKIDDPKECAVAQIEFDLWQARLYRKAGYLALALNNYEIAEDEANQQRLDDLWATITKEADEFVVSVKNER